MTDTLTGRLYAFAKYVAERNPDSILGKKALTAMGDAHVGITPTLSPLNGGKGSSTLIEKLKERMMFWPEEIQKDILSIIMGHASTRKDKATVSHCPIPEVPTSPANHTLIQVIRSAEKFIWWMYILNKPESKERELAKNMHKILIDVCKQYDNAASEIRLNEMPTHVNGMAIAYIIKMQRMFEQCSGEANYPKWWDRVFKAGFEEARRCMPKRESIIEREISFTSEISGKRYKFDSVTKLIEAFIKATERESGEDAAFDTMKSFWRWWRTQQDMELRQADRAIGGYVERFIADRKNMGVHDFNDSQIDDYFGLNQIEGGE